VKTLAEIAIEAGLVTKANAAKAGRMAEDRSQPLVAMLVRELGVDEVALVAAFKKQLRVPLLDPGDVHVDPEALRRVKRDVCARLRVLPLSVANDVIKLAMADPTDTTAIAEIEELTGCEIDITVLPLSAIDELVDKAYRLTTSTVVTRPGGTMFVTARGKVQPIEGESEVSVTAQIPLSALREAANDDLELRIAALVQVLVGKGLVTEAELVEARRKLKPANS
jgi:hypothetical protein